MLLKNNHLRTQALEPGTPRSPLRTTIYISISTSMSRRNPIAITGKQWPEKRLTILSKYLTPEITTPSMLQELAKNHRIKFPRPLPWARLNLSFRTSILNSLKTKKLIKNKRKWKERRPNKRSRPNLTPLKSTKKGKIRRNRSQKARLARNLQRRNNQNRWKI